MFEFLGFLSPVLLPGALITLAWPRRFLWQYVVLVVLSFAGLSVWLSHQKMDGPGGGLAIVALWLIIIVMAIAIGVKLALSAWMAKTHPASEAKPDSLWSRAADFLLLLAIFVMVGGLLLNTFSEVLRTARPSAHMHGALGAIAFVFAVVGWLGRRLKDGRLRRFAPPLLLAFAGVIAGAIAVSLHSMHKVELAAQQAGGDQDYCIQMADARGEYTPVAARTDLSMLTLRATRHGSMAMQHHALMFRRDPAGLTMLNWSYASGEFRRDAMHQDEPQKWPGVYCQLTPRFVEHLPLVAKKADAPVQVTLRGTTFHIPSAYKARVRTGEAASVFLGASAPNFAPSATGAFDDGIFIEYDGGDWPARLLGDDPAPFKPGPYGLEVRRDKEFDEYRYQTATETSAVRCFSGNHRYPPSCQHAFSLGELTFNFRHPPSQLSDWRQIEGRVVALWRSLEARPSAPSPSPAPSRR